ncbi:hypothetical protein Hanom_Chr13g01203001 [Helianthus anomalus]
MSVSTAHCTKLLTIISQHKGNQSAPNWSLEVAILSSIRWITVINCQLRVKMGIFLKVG